MIKQNIIIIGSSTGGPIILEQIFSGLPKMPVVILIVQHLRPFFMSDFQSHIQVQTGMQVTIPKEGQIIEGGYVYIAQADKHMILQKNRMISFIESEKVNSVRPSIDVTMKSLKKDKNISILGIILTGMGRDGTEGMQYLKSIGGITIAQDPSTASIRTMPINAISTGIVDTICTPDGIKQAILNFANS